MGKNVHSDQSSIVMGNVAPLHKRIKELEQEIRNLRYPPHGKDGVPLRRFDYGGSSGRITEYYDDLVMDPKDRGIVG